MNIHTLKIQDFSVMDFFLKLTAKGISFLHTAGPDQNEQWSVLAWNPVAQATTWEELKRLHIARKTSSKSQLPFCGGAIGSFTYDSKNPRPDFRFYDHFLCYNHSTEEIFTSDSEFVGEVWGKRFPAKTKVISASPSGKHLLPLKLTWPKEAYEKSFNAIKEYILSGDIYQINLTQQLSCDYVGDLKELFKVICLSNPAPFAAYLDQDTTQILSASPEHFISFKNGKITTSPVKGTRPRGKTTDEDERMKVELLTSEKEEAELNMVTDLLRNDIGQMSVVGSVKVKERRALQVCTTVFHTYSVIEGIARPEVNAIDILKACLPGGSISGCPKQRACEIIEELEPLSRGLYTGTLAILSDDGSMDSSILIRTLIHEQGKLSLGVGGGIVADSECENEYQESLQKASSFLKL